MSNTLLQKKYCKPKCTQIGHQNEPLDFICIQSDCQLNPLVCYLCLLQKHHEHDNIVQKIFFNKLIALSSSSKHIVPLSTQIDSLFESIKQKLLKFQHQYQNPEVIFQTFAKFKHLIVSQCMSFFNLIDKINQIRQAPEDKLVKKLNSFIQNYYFKYFAGIQSQKWVDLDLTEYLLSEKKDNIQYIVLQFQKLQSQGKVSDAQILNLFPLHIQINKKIKVIFTQALAPTCMEIISPTQAKMGTSGSQRLVVLEPCLSKTKSVKKWTVKIVKLASWIGVGVCHKDKIVSDEFNFNYSNTGHGSYLISSNGYCWSSYKKQYNSKFQSFSFTTGDVIDVQYSPKQHKLRYKKDGTDQTYEIDIEDNDDPIHPEVNLTGIGDEVEIINK